jgi:hypothetical protein
MMATKLVALVVLVCGGMWLEAADAQGTCSANSPCPDSNNCCSQWGYCGTGPPYCGTGCISGPCTPGGGDSTPTPSGGSGLGATLTKSVYEQLFPGHLEFYAYDKLIEAAKSFPKFGTTGDQNTKKKEIAAFAAHVWQETSGLKKIREDNQGDYCDSSRPQFPCNGHKFYGRGPLQLSWNYNYGTCGKALGLNLLANPDLVATDALVSFKASLWFWSDYGDSKIPNIHSVITGNWSPTNDDKNANRYPGFGLTIDIINGGLECNKNSDAANNRVNYYKKFCKELGVEPGSHVDCKQMKPFYGVNVATS